MVLMMDQVCERATKRRIEEFIIRSFSSLYPDCTAHLRLGSTIDPPRGHIPICMAGLLAYKTYSLRGTYIVYYICPFYRVNKELLERNKRSEW